MIPLETARLLIRPWTLDAADAAAFHGIWSSPRVIWWGHAVDADESLRVLRRVLRRSAAMAEGLGWCAVVERQSGVIVGGVMLQPAPYVDGIEIGYHFAHDAWGRGFATEAARALVAYGLETLALDRIVAAIHVENSGSRRVADKIGMVRVGEVTHESTAHELYSIDRVATDGA